MKIDLVVFDLDGTLISSHETIYKATVHTLNELGIEGDIPHNEFRSRIGMHFEDIFNDFGIKVPDFEIFIKIYKSVYFDFIDASGIYPGVLETFNYLKRNRIKISLLTTKSQDQAEKILDYFNLSRYFDYIMGRRPGLDHKPSPEPLLKICTDVSVQPGNSLIIGDSELDIQCGQNAGTRTGAVTYGYRTKEVLEKENPDLLLNSINELLSIDLLNDSIRSNAAG